MKHLIDNSDFEVVISKLEQAKAIAITLSVNADSNIQLNKQVLVNALNAIRDLSKFSIDTLEEAKIA